MTTLAAPVERTAEDDLAVRTLLRPFDIYKQHSAAIYNGISFESLDQLVRDSIAVGRTLETKEVIQELLNAGEVKK